MHKIDETDRNHVADFIPENKIKQQRTEDDESEVKRVKTTECLME